MRRHCRSSHLKTVESVADVSPQNRFCGIMLAAQFALGAVIARGEQRYNAFAVGSECGIYLPVRDESCGFHM